MSVIRRSEYLPAGLVSCLGLMVLTMLTLAPRDAAVSVGIIFPPWIARERAMVAVAALHLPILDVRWNGHFIVVGLQDGYPPASWALPASAFLVNTIAGGLCRDATTSSGTQLQEAAQ